MSNSNKSKATECRYVIQDRHVIDTKKEIKSGNPIYIREILDSGSSEFQRSAISKKDRLDIVGTLGLDSLIPVLDECFRSKEGCDYNATKEAVFALHSLLNGAYPALGFLLVENDSKTRLVLQNKTSIAPNGSKL